MKQYRRSLTDNSACFDQLRWRISVLLAAAAAFFLFPALVSIDTSVQGSLEIVYSGQQ